MAGTLSGRVAVITGAGSGIGRSCALAFARDGAQVVVSDVVVEGGNETVNIIKHAHGEATFVKCDVSQPQEIEALFNGVADQYGRLDCAVNNAGIGGVQMPTAEYPLDNWQKVLDINLTAPWLCMQYEIVHMLKLGRGAIVNMAIHPGCDRCSLQWCLRCCQTWSYRRNTDCGSRVFKPGHSHQRCVPWLY